MRFALLHPTLWCMKRKNSAITCSSADAPEIDGVVYVSPTLPEHAVDLVHIPVLNPTA
ncbi:MAG: hypothetical protein NTAFB09_01250 [Nitrosospira sp.]